MKNKKEGIKIVNNMIITDLKEMGYDAKEKSTMKNGVEFIGISIKEKGDFFATVVYTKEIIEDAARKNTSLKEVIKEVLEAHKTARVHYLKKRIDTNIFSNKEFIIPHLKIRLQKKSNENIIKRNYEDMEKILIVDIGEYIVKVNSEILEFSKISEEEAWVYGEANIFAETEIMSINEMMSKLMGLTLEEYHTYFDFLPIYIVTNKTNFHGASAILNTQAMNKLRIKFNTNKFFVLPSSVHKCIVMPYEEGKSIEELSEMVKTINTSEVCPEDRLSDKAYILEI